jgi:hypothetical protein
VQKLGLRIREDRNLAHVCARLSRLLHAGAAELALFKLEVVNVGALDKPADTKVVRLVK